MRWVGKALVKEGSGTNKITEMEERETLHYNKINMVYLHQINTSSNNFTTIGILKYANLGRVMISQNRRVITKEG